MPTIRLYAKLDVNLKPRERMVAGIDPVSFAIGVAYALRAEIAMSTVVTSLNDGSHRAGSKHYVDLAVDLRTKDMPHQPRLVFLREIAELLEPLGFDVVFESEGQVNEHLHLEYDPKANERLVQRLP